MWLYGLVLRSSKSADRTARLRIRTRAGRWLVCHGSHLDNLDGTSQTTVVIEPATATETAPILADAYDLTPREREIVRLIARGLDTRAMANELQLSAHTVRDHVKAVLAKTDVSSRGELLARLFTEQYWPRHAQTVISVHD
jgi:DNA-binding NarL/FixJ family response regulator